MKIFIFFVLVFSSSPIFAKGYALVFFAANDIYEVCDTDSSSLAATYCEYYFAGLIEGATMTGLSSGSKPFCPPTGTRASQARLIFLNYARENPETLHLPSAQVSISALSEKWPCQ